MLLICVIFLAEVSVVTVGTLRIIFVSRGHKILAPILGFFEVSIWLLAMSQTMGNLQGDPSAWTLASWSYFLAFALGFTLGNYLGILFEKQLAIGSLKLHVITQRDAGQLARDLRMASFGATIIRGQGASGPVDIIMTVIRRKQLTQVLTLIESFDSRAFYAVNELQSTSSGIFPLLRDKRTPEVEYSWHLVSKAEAVERSEQKVG